MKTIDVSPEAYKAIMKIKRKQDEIALSFLLGVIALLVGVFLAVASNTAQAQIVCYDPTDPYSKPEHCHEVGSEIICVPLPVCDVGCHP